MKSYPSTHWPSLPNIQLERISGRIRFGTTKDWPPIPMMNYEEYIDHFQIMYVHRSILRAIPNICDSLTIARRKVMYTMLTKKYTGEIKTISLASLVAEETHYHHGQASLADTISKMAQDFAGSNNCNLLLPKAYFGSRDE